MYVYTLALISAPATISVAMMVFFVSLESSVTAVNNGVQPLPVSISTVAPDCIRYAYKHIDHSSDINQDTVSNVTASLAM